MSSSKTVRAHCTIVQHSVLALLVQKYLELGLEHVLVKDGVRVLEHASFCVSICTFVLVKQVN
jgi:hypothetical protein